MNLKDVLRDYFCDISYFLAKRKELAFGDVPLKKSNWKISDSGYFVLVKNSTCDSSCETAISLIHVCLS